MEFSGLPGKPFCEESWQSAMRPKRSAKSPAAGDRNQRECVAQALAKAPRLRSEGVGRCGRGRDKTPVSRLLHPRASRGLNFTYEMTRKPPARKSP